MGMSPDLLLKSVTVLRLRIMEYSTRGTVLVERKPLPTMVSNSATFNFGQNY